MLSTWGDYTIWSDKMVDGEGEEYITIIVSNGQLVWECNKVTYANIPPARKSQKWSNFLPLLLSILRQNAFCNDKLNLYKCEFVIAESVLNLTIRERMSKGMSLFIDLQLQLSKSRESSMQNLLVLSTGAMAKYGEEIKQLGHNNTKLVEINHKLESQLAKIADDKDTLQNEMMRKTCILLNSRNNEIRRLRVSQKCDESDLESENSGKKHLNQDRNSPERKSIQGTSSSSSSSLQQDDKLLKSNDLCPNANNKSLKSFKVPPVVESADLLKSLTQEISQSQSDIVKPNILSSSNNNCNDSTDYKSSSSSSSSSSHNDSNVYNGSSWSKGNPINLFIQNFGSQPNTKNKKKILADSDDEVDPLKLTNTTEVKSKKRKKKKMGDSDSDTD